MSTTEKWTEGQIWNNLKNSWRRYRIAKIHNSREDMLKYAKQIRALQEQLGRPHAKFPELGLMD